MDLLALHAASSPDKTAVVDDNRGAVRTLTWAQLDAVTNQLCHVLVGSGLGPGGTIAWCGQNSLGVVVLVDAARRLGVTAVPVNYRFTDEEAAYVIDHSDASMVYVDAELAPMLGRIRSDVPSVRSVLVFDGDVPDGDDPWYVPVDSRAAAVPTTPPASGDGSGDGGTMIYTSGTTGKPKGAVRKEASVDMAAIGALIQLIGYTGDDVYLTTGPLYHSGPLGFMAIAQALGQTVVVQRRFDPEDWLRLVQTYRCTSTFSAPTSMRAVCNLDPGVLDRYDRSSMRIMIANAAPWTMALKRRYLDVFPPESLFEVYGSTELGVNTMLLPADQLRKPGSCGKEVPMLEIRLYDPDGNIVTGVGPQAAGEVYVRASSVFDDYYKQHDRYVEDRRDGFQTVGDIAYRDEEGYLYICDRKRDMVISGGVNVYPAEVEAALELHPDVYEAAVFGIPSEEWGEAVHAAVVARPGSPLAESRDADALIAHARQHLAGFKVPRTVDWLDELPKTGSGKVLKRELRQPYWELAAAPEPHGG
jgi:fatty-acyl-CoA synthase/long-chain acyl-CoA synthetase